MNLLKFTNLFLFVAFLTTPFYAQDLHDHKLCGHGSTSVQKVSTENIDIAFKEGKTIIADRFGNTYLIDDPQVTKKQNKSGMITHCTEGHFTLYFEDGWDDSNTTDIAMQELVCDVFSYLSSFITASQDASQISIKVDKKSLGGGALGSGTPYWNLTFPDITRKMGHAMIPDILAGNPIESFDGYHGLLEIDAQTDWFIDDTPETENDINGSGQKDLYTVVLHEALHVLGFASRISSGGQPMALNDTDPFAFYSEWDKHLRHTQNNTTIPLIELQEAPTNEFCTEYQYTHPTIPENLLQDVCNEMSFDFEGTQHFVVNTESVGSLQNSLSHFTNNCPNDNFVMHPFLDIEETRRIVTVKEKEALCNLGYITDVCTTTDEFCFVFVRDDLFILEENHSMELTSELLLENDIIQGMDIVNISYDLDCGDVSGLNINPPQDENSPYNITGSDLGDFNFCYTIEDCDGACYNGQINIKVLDLDFSIYDKCNELNSNDCRVFFDDFEYSNIDEYMWMQYAAKGSTFIGGEPFLIDNAIGNSPDLFATISSTPDAFPYCDMYGNDFNPIATYLSNVVHLYSGINNNNDLWIEGVTFALCEPIYPGDYVEVNFLGSGFKECNDAILNIGFTNEGVEAGEIINDLILDEQQITLAPLLPLAPSNDIVEINAPYTLTFDNNGELDWNHIFLEKTLEEVTSKVFIDDLEVLRLRDLQIHGETQIQACPGEIELQYEITDYRNNFEVNITNLPTDVTLIPTASVPGTTFTVNDGIYNPENETFSTLLTIRLEIPSTHTSGSFFDITLSTSDPVGNGCGILEQTINTQIQIQENPITIQGIYNEDTQVVEVEVCNLSSTSQTVDLIFSFPSALEIQDALGFNTSTNNVGGIELSLNEINLIANQCENYSFPISVQGNVDCNDYLSFAAAGTSACEEATDIFGICDELVGITTIDITSLSCNNDSDAAIDITVSGGSTPYTYIWSTGETTEDLTGLSANTYSVTITDASGYIVTEEITIDESGLIIQPSIEQPTCHDTADGIVELTVNGGVLPYTFEWAYTPFDNPDFENPDPVPGAEGPILNTFQQGYFYFVSVFDASGCNTYLEFGTASNPITISSQLLPPLCEGDTNGGIAISVTGGTKPHFYEWSTGATTEDLINIPEGTYTVTVTDNNGCMLEEEFVLDIGDYPPLQLLGNLHRDCFAQDNIENAEVNITGSAICPPVITDGSGNYGCNWTDGTYTITPTKDGDDNCGVTTFDMVLVSKHILGVGGSFLPFTPYQILAADVNASNSVTTLDLVEMRRLILNIDTEFQSNSSWRFIPENHDFPDSNDPSFWNFPEQINYQYPDNCAELDFVGVKIGDVNCSAAADCSTSNLLAENTGNTFLTTAIESYGSNSSQPITVLVQTQQDITDLYGYQFAMSYNHLGYDLLNILSGDTPGFSKNNNTHEQNGILRFQWTTDDVSSPSSFAKGTTLFKLVLKKKRNWIVKIKGGHDFKFQIREDMMPSQLVDTNLRKNTLSLANTYLYKETENSAEFSLYPNPVHSSIQLKMDIENDNGLDIQIIDLTGKVVQTHTMENQNQPFEIDINHLNEGIYFITIKNGKESFVKRFIKTLK